MSALNRDLIYPHVMDRIDLREIYDLTGCRASPPEGYHAVANVQAPCPGDGIVTYNRHLLSPDGPTPGSGPLFGDWLRCGAKMGFRGGGMHLHDGIVLEEVRLIRETYRGRSEG